MKAYWEMEVQLNAFFDLGTRCRRVNFTPRPLYPQGKSPWYPLDRRLVGPRTVLDAVMKRKLQSPRGESNPRTPIVQPII
jgi:hypothetical protein